MRIRSVISFSGTPTASAIPLLVMPFSRMRL
jgi:hypothetical protein